MRLPGHAAACERFRRKSLLSVVSALLATAGCALFSRPFPEEAIESAAKAQVQAHYTDRESEPFSSLVAHLDRGDIGLTYDGLYALRTSRNLTPRQRELLLERLSLANRLRLVEYEQLARKLGLSQDDVSVIQTLYAPVWMELGSDEWWIRSRSGVWNQRASEAATAVDEIP